MIEKKSADELLNQFHDIHLNELVSALINIDIFSNKKPNDIVAERAGPSMGQNQIPTRIEVRAKDALVQEEIRKNAQLAVLKSIEEVRKEIKDLKI